MKPKKTHKSEVKIVVYFKRRANGVEYTQQEITQKVNRKEQYFYCYFPKKGGGWITNHERGFDDAEAQLKRHIAEKNVIKGMIFLCSLKTGAEERVVLFRDLINWEFFHRPEFVTTAAGHRYISRYQSLPVLKNIVA